MDRELIEANRWASNLCGNCHGVIAMFFLVDIASDIVEGAVGPHAVLGLVLGALNGFLAVKRTREAWFYEKELKR